jgi:signal transduction histidine kinase
VTYKYRLEGLEDAWQEADRRTEAFYTHLGPGTYTFQVVASSGNDMWTTPVASPPFVVLPSFYQTTWFRVLCILAGLALAFGIFTLRVRVIARAIRSRAEERADERIRIARELHDTLLQGIQGLLLNFHVAAQKIAPDDASRTMLDRALATADRIILEGRNRVSSLRSEHLTDGELVASLENAGRDLQPDGKAHFAVKRSGTIATLQPAVADEIFCIAREALTNAFRHSGAAHIGVELAYGRRYFRMVCADDGRGFDAPGAGKASHWGLRGMAERADKLGGRLQVLSEAACGTEIIASVPSYRAYQHHSRLMFYLRALLFSERDSARTGIRRFEAEFVSRPFDGVASRE